MKYFTKNRSNNAVYTNNEPRTKLYRYQKPMQDRLHQGQFALGHDTDHLYS